MSSLGDLVLTNIGDKEVVEPPSKDVFVNRTILYQPVSQQDPMLFVGSDDRWIYAVELTTGAVRWKVLELYSFIYRKTWTKLSTIKRGLNYLP